MEGGKIQLNGKYVEPKDAYKSITTKHHEQEAADIGESLELLKSIEKVPPRKGKDGYTIKSHKEDITKGTNQNG